ncbi:MAG: 6-bladed beta-propeller [Bacteroidales bacterium]|nr:6-bladed beta-propeller [Bacteroidales bacterium]
MEKKFFIYYVITLVITSICGCGAQTNYTSVDKNEKGVIVFDLTEALENVPVPIDEMIDSIKIIPLESSRESLLSYIYNLHVSTQNIFIWDLHTGINIFDHQGKFIKKIDNGTGPKEIGVPGAMSYDEENKLLYVYDISGNKIVKFNSEGVFLSYNPLDRMTAIRDIDIANNTMLVAQEEPDKSFTISAGDTTGYVFDTFVLGNYQYPFAFRKFIMRYDGGFNIKSMLDNNIYYYKDNTIKAKYELKYPMANIDYAKYERMLNMEQDIPNGKYIFEGEYLESKDYLYTCLVSNNKGKLLFTHKTTGKSVCFTAKQCSLTMFMSIEDVYLDNDNWFVGIILPEKIVSYDIPKDYRWDGSNLNDKISDKDMEKLRAIKSDDNPMIVLYKLKSKI